jgi:hypothetical protein
LTAPAGVETVTVLAINRPEANVKPTAKDRSWKRRIMYTTLRYTTLRMELNRSTIDLPEIPVFLRTLIRTKYWYFLSRLVLKRT